jgi:hypothetical protein
VVGVALVLAGCADDDSSGTRPSVSVSISLPSTTTPSDGGEAAPEPTEAAPEPTDAEPEPTDAAPPTTEARPPTTEAPPPATQAPATDEASPDPPATEAASPEPPATEDAAPAADETSSEDGGTTWWPWVLLVAIVATAIVAVTLVARRRTQASKTDAWDRLSDSVLTDAVDSSLHIAALDANGVRLVAGRDTERLRLLVAWLDRLVQEAPTPERATTVVPVADAARRLHAAVDAAALDPLGADGVNYSNVHGAAVALHAAADQARAATQSPITAGGPT